MATISSRQVKKNFKNYFLKHFKLNYHDEKIKGFYFKNDKYHNQIFMSVRILQHKGGVSFAPFEIVSKTYFIMSTDNEQKFPTWHETRYFFYK